MKKLLALLLALALCLGTVSALAATPDEIPDNITSPDGTYAVAFVTDIGQLKDKSFNEGTWNGVKLFASENSLTYKYYQPANGSAATDDDRYDAMKAAADAGAKAIVAAGWMQGNALEKAAKEFTDVKFIFIDGWGMGLDNVVGVAYKEEQCGYFAGYAAVSDGFTKLGFSGGGGGTNPACERYGYGYIQGANDAAAKLGKNVDLRFTWAYGASFSASPELQTMMNGWYETGTEVVFACGGAIFDSIAAAAAANDGFVIGVDVDQSGDSETVITSALKGLSEGTYQMLAKVFDGTFEAGSVSLGVAENAVGLPVDNWTLETFTVEEYQALIDALLAGELTIDGDAAEGDPNVKGPWTNVTVEYVE